MAIIESATRDALLVLRILKLIPRNHWISTPEIKQALEESGYAIEPRRLQRILRDIHPVFQCSLHVMGIGDFRGNFHSQFLLDIL